MYSGTLVSTDHHHGVMLLSARIGGTAAVAPPPFRLGDPPSVTVGAVP